MLVWMCYCEVVTLLFINQFVALSKADRPAAAWWSWTSAHSLIQYMGTDDRSEHYPSIPQASARRQVEAGHAKCMWVLQFPTALVCSSETTEHRAESTSSTRGKKESET